MDTIKIIYIFAEIKKNKIMQVTKNDVNKSGIYCIRNMSNQKVYIGKAKNIYVRICQHISLLRKKDYNENRHLINA